MYSSYKSICNFSFRYPFKTICIEIQILQIFSLCLPPDPIWGSTLSSLLKGKPRSHSDFRMSHLSNSCHFTAAQYFSSSTAPETLLFIISLSLVCLERIGTNTISKYNRYLRGGGPKFCYPRTLGKKKYTMYHPSYTFKFLIKTYERSFGAACLSVCKW